MLTAGSCAHFLYSRTTLFCFLVPESAFARPWLNCLMIGMPCILGARGLDRTPCISCYLVRIAMQLEWSSVPVSYRYNRYFVANRDCDSNATASTACRCLEKTICRAKGGLLHTHAIAYHARALDWLVPLLSKADEAASTRLMPVDLEIRTYMEQHQDSVKIYAILPSPIVGQNHSTQSDIFHARMYEERKRLHP